MFKNTNGKAAKVAKTAMALLVAVGSLVGGVGCDEEALINLATQAVQAQLDSVASESIMPGSSSPFGPDISSDFGSDDSSWLDAGGFDPDCGC